MEGKHYLQTLFTAPLIKAAIVEKKCGECLTEGKGKACKVKTKLPGFSGLAS